MDCSIELSFLCHPCVFTIKIKLNNVAIASANNKLRLIYNAYCPCSKCTKIEIENKHLCFNMESTHITWRCSCIDKVLSTLGETHTDVFSHHCTCGQMVWCELASLWNKAPKSHFLCATDGKLIVLCWSKLNVFCIATPCKASWTFVEDWLECKRGDDMSVSCVPNEHLTVKSIPGREQ